MRTLLAALSCNASLDSRKRERSPCRRAFTVGCADQSSHFPRGDWVSALARTRAAERMKRRQRSAPGWRWRRASDAAPRARTVWNTVDRLTPRCLATSATVMNACEKVVRRPSGLRAESANLGSLVRPQIEPSQILASRCYPLRSRVDRLSRRRPRVQVPSTPQEIDRFFLTRLVGAILGTAESRKPGVIRFARS
jgi:hypothetical protein